MNGLLRPIADDIFNDRRLASCWMCINSLPDTIGLEGTCRFNTPWERIHVDNPACMHYDCKFVPESLNATLSIENIMAGDKAWGCYAVDRIKAHREILGIPELDTVPDNEIDLEDPSFTGWTMYPVPYRQGDEKDGPRRIWVKCPYCTDEEIKIYAGCLTGTQVIWCTRCGTRFTVKHEWGQTFYRLEKNPKHEGLEQTGDVDNAGTT